MNISPMAWNYIWRPILAGKTTLSEIDNHYTLDDLADLNEAMDIENEMERFMMEKVKKEAKRK